MPNLRAIVATVLVIGLAMVLPGANGSAADKRAPKPDNALEQLHKKLTEEGERQTRAIAVSQPGAKSLVNGIQQIFIDSGKDSGSFKVEGTDYGAAPVSANSPPPPCPYRQGMKTASLVKIFPEVTWHVCVTDMGLKGLWVGPVQMKRTPTTPWITVLYQAGLAEIYVPYHQTNFRPYDMEWTSMLDPVTQQDAGNNGSLITLTNENVPTVVAEVRDRGVAWLCKQVTMAVRRGEEFVVWGVTDGGNYDNIIQYGFQDDGTMTFRMGNTGFNAPQQPSEGHMHNGLWRVDMDLGGSMHNTAYWFTHNEPVPNTAPFLKAQDKEDPYYVIFNSIEAKRQWNPLQFSSVLIESANTTNRFGHNLGYEFTPEQPGISRHYGPADNWTQYDVWVTDYHASELGWTAANAWAPPDNYLQSYLSGESVTDRDLVVWIKSSAHHDPADEDRSASDMNTTNVTGVTLVHWSGFNIEPHNLFNANPLGGPRKCQP